MITGGDYKFCGQLCIGGRLCTKGRLLASRRLTVFVNR